MSSAWQRYKEKIGNSKPWHLLNINNYVSEELEKSRFQLCSECPELIQTTKQCKECGCFMTLKVKLEAAKCPIGKW